jgi:hypothetical protein
MTFVKWLLERFGVEQALIGDVVEECVRGRSLFWCWRQVLTALVSRTAQDISAHMKSRPLASPHRDPPISIQTGRLGHGAK